MSKNLREVCVSFSWTDSKLCIYHLFQWSNLNYFHNSLWITLPIQSFLVSYSLCANLLQSIIMWFILSSLSPSPFMLRLVYFCFKIVLMALFCAAIRRDSVFLLRFPFLNHIQVFSCEILLICHLKCLYSCFSSHFCFGWSPLVFWFPSFPVPFSKPLGIVPTAPITIDITVTFMFHSFFFLVFL